MIVFVYAAGIIFYIHFKQKQKKKIKDPEMNLSHTLSTDNGSTIDSRIGMENMVRFASLFFKYNVIYDIKFKF